MTKKRCLAYAAALLLMVSGVAHADLTAPNANLAIYQTAYGDASENYKSIRYNAESAQIGKIKEALAALGYFPYKISNNYYRTLETAIRLFDGQMRLGGGDGRAITPLMQAMLADYANLPKAISPVIDVTDYSWESGNTYTAYTYARIMRSSVAKDTSVGFSGIIVSAGLLNGTHYYGVQMENDAEKLVYVAYQPLPRTTVFQVGDAVAVFGVTEGEQAPGLPGMETAALLVRADRVGYSD